MCLRSYQKKKNFEDDEVGQQNTEGTIKFTKNTDGRLKVGFIADSNQQWRGQASGKEVSYKKEWSK